MPLGQLLNSAAPKVSPTKGTQFGQRGVRHQKTEAQTLARVPKKIHDRVKFPVGQRSSFEEKGGTGHCSIRGVVGEDVWLVGFKTKRKDRETADWGSVGKKFAKKTAK